MPLSPKIRDAIEAILLEGEGNAPHLYRCTAGEVTIGKGKMIPLVDHMDFIPMYRQDESEATKEEKRAEYILIKSRPYGIKYSAKTFAPFAKLHAKDSDIEKWFQEHMKSFYSECVMLFRKENGYHANFDDFPAALQIALFDMNFNLGNWKLINVFTSFLQAVKDRNWQLAAKESERKNPGLTLRNEKIKLLLNSLGPGEQLAFPDVKRKFMCALFQKEK